MSNNQPALEINNVSKYFGGVCAVDHVSMDLDLGESTVIIGPNGAGKTTLFNLVTGAIPLDEGQIILYGEDVSKASVQRRSELCLSRTYQTCNLFKNLTVEQNIYLSLRNSSWRNSRGFLEVFRNWKTNGIRQERINEVLEQVQLTHLRNTEISSMSHGEQRQLELGMALAPDPKIILFDEPMAGLSPTERVFIGELIKKLASERIILVIEHDIDFALSLTNRIAVMDHGKLVFMGTPDEVRASSKVQKIYKLD